MNSATLSSLEQAQVPPVAITPVTVPPVSSDVVKLVLVGSVAVIGISLLLYLRGRRGK